MTPRSDAHPAAGWLFIAALVLGWDLMNTRSLTSYARSHRRATGVIGAVIVTHLVGVLPARIDPFAYLARWVRP